MMKIANKGQPAIFAAVKNEYAEHLSELPGVVVIEPKVQEIGRDALGGGQGGERVQGSTEDKQPEQPRSLMDRLRGKYPAPQPGSFGEQVNHEYKNNAKPGPHGLPKINVNGKDYLVKQGDMKYSDSERVGYEQAREAGIVVAPCGEKSSTANRPTLSR